MQNERQPLTDTEAGSAGIPVGDGEVLGVQNEIRVTALQERV
jgi:hypothetical protein